ncbi:MAG: hypothetical protein CL927_00175 [Deltaproteobacteria bacterium]|nr:hypothetical protein [Deltaproteobacteria bacterium]HCH62849.1 hypothetical protein [Deltaproteobacteria bacterium]
MSALPTPIRALNAVGRAWRSAGFSPRRLDPDALMDEALRAARKEPGLADATLGEISEFRAGLDVVCTALEQLPELPTAGRFAARRQLLRALRQRIRRLAWKARNPERFAMPLQPPVIVLGLPRTGTTFLHRLLAAPERARALPMWEVAMPFPPLHGADQRRQSGERGAAVMQRVLTDFDAKHATGSEEPEECMHLQNEAFFSWSWLSNYPIPTYTRWLSEADPAVAYDVWLDVLRFIQSGSPSSRLTLKSPSHLAHIEAILDRIPQARFVWTHREPEQVVPSFASLIASTRGLSTTTQTADPHALGRELSDFLAEQLQRGLAARARIPTGHLIDIPFDDLKRDPLATVASIHHHFGLPWSPEVSRAVQSEVQARPRNRKGAHHYALADFGLSRGLVQELFANYAVPASSVGPSVDGRASAKG